MPYSQIFKDHLEHPRNGGELDDADTVAEEINPVCGDRLRLALKIDNRTIKAARFLAYGCPPVLVCASALTELIQGKTVKDALQVTRKQLVEAVGGLPLRKQHAAALAIETLRSAIENKDSGGKPTFPT
ncbi:MAG TPA: iron-sulfur cluster assembly scaffold protein [Pyrinomonadaceae bacterium]|nr:iron-sulfur cluster assembly scaffold protein [Pyrinomonadaceae bacterium]